MLPLQIAWCWLKESLVRATKRLILHFSCCSFSCQQLLPLHGPEIQTLCGKGWEPSPGLSNILGGVKSIYINTRFPEAWVGTPNHPQALLEQSLLTVGISCGIGNYTHLSNFLCNFKQPAQFGVLELVLFLKSSNNFQDKQKYLSSPKHSDFTDIGFAELHLLNHSFWTRRKLADTHVVTTATLLSWSSVRLCSSQQLS